MTVPAFNYFHHLCSLSVLFPCFSPDPSVLPTFHCKVKELLVLCEDLGGKGHSGAELWVVKLAGSEQDPFTELYIAHTLETVFKWVTNVLTGTVALPWPQCLTTKAPTTPPTHDRLTTDQWLPLLYFTYTSMQKKLQQKRNSVSCKYSHRPLSYLHYLFVPPIFPCLLPGFHTLWKRSFLKYNREKGISFKAWFTLDPHVPCWVLVSAGLLLWVQSSPTYLRHQHLVDLHGLELTQLSNIALIN